MVRELPEETLKIVDLIPGLEEVRSILERIDIQQSLKSMIPPVFD